LLPVTEDIHVLDLDEVFLVALVLLLVFTLYQATGQMDFGFVTPVTKYLDGCSVLNQ